MPHSCISPCGFESAFLRSYSRNEQVTIKPTLRHFLIKGQGHSILIDWALSYFHTEDKRTVFANRNVSHCPGSFIGDINPLKLDLPSEGVAFADGLEHRCGEQRRDAAATLYGQHTFNQMA
jgi:hypothetical protein